MTQLIQTIRRRAEQRAAYAETVRELRAMSIDTALDLDIYHGDIPKIARRAVYGHDGPRPHRIEHMTFIETLADRLRKRARYTRTLAETAIAAHRYRARPSTSTAVTPRWIARRAVYGI